jgi:hypothetical protein
MAEVAYEFALHQHVQDSSLPTQLCTQHEQRDKRRNGVDMLTCLLLVLGSIIFGVYLHVLETAVTFAFFVKVCNWTLYEETSAFYSSRLKE